MIGSWNTDDEGAGREDTMRSDELNHRIKVFDDVDDVPYNAFGGKPVPHIGWFWREVNFDRIDPDGSYLFGVIPAGAEGNDVPLVGFMENDKWGYDYVCANEAQWMEIKRLLVVAVEDPTPKNFERANVAIQALGERGDN